MYQLLRGMRILDLTRLLPGGYATQLLADLGAEVLKVEDPWQGDYMRWMEPHFPGTGESALYWGLNRNKKSMKLNLKSEEGRKIFFKLTEDYDVVIEGFRPGVMDSLGLGYEKLQELNPRVILCSISGYGQDGPYRHRSGHDINYTAIAGSLAMGGIPGGRPLIPAVQIADVGGGGLLAAVGILAAYVSRERTGEGQYLDIAMMDGVVSWMAMIFMQLAAGDANLKRGETFLSGGIPCYNVYQTKDCKYLSLGALEPKFWKNFCTAVEREELITQQFSRDSEVKARVQEIFLGKTREEWVEFFEDHDVCCEPVLEPQEVAEHPQIKHRGLFRELPHPAFGPVKVTANPLKFTGQEEERDLAPPGFGENTREILLGCGFSAEQIALWEKEGII